MIFFFFFLVVSIFSLALTNLHSRRDCDNADVCAYVCVYVCSSAVSLLILLFPLLFKLKTKRKKKKEDNKVKKGNLSNARMHNPRTSVKREKKGVRTPVHTHTYTHTHPPTKKKRSTNNVQERFEVVVMPSMKAALFSVFLSVNEARRDA